MHGEGREGGRTYNFCYFGYGTEAGREFASVYEVVRGRVEFVTFGHVSTHANFVGSAVELGLDVDDEGRRLEGAFHDLLHLGLAKRSEHPASDDFFLQVRFDFCVVVLARRMVGEDDGLSELGKFTHWETIA
jgi:hypothetical protein